MLSSPAFTPPSQAMPAAPTVAEHNLSAPTGKLPAILAEHWKSLSSTQRQAEFKAHYEAVQTSLKGIEAFVAKSVDQAIHASNADPANPALKNLQAGRKRALQQLRDYLFDKAAPKMLDLLYLNQTREHLEDIHQQLGNADIDLESRLGAALELAEGLDVCEEGVALNILACAKNLNTRTQGHPLTALYRSARDELINQHLLIAVRTSHATPVNSSSKGDQAVEYKESENPLHKSMEIHEVQALRNALSKDLELQYLPDRYINPDFEKTVGSIAKSNIPQLITTHAVASRVADELLNWMRSTSLLSEHALSVDGTCGLHQVIDISGDKYKDLTTSLQNEMGVEVSLLFDSPDEDFTKLALVSHETLTQRLVEWIGHERGTPGSPVHGLGETLHEPVSSKQITKAMSHFLEPVSHHRKSYPHYSAEVFNPTVPEPVINRLIMLHHSTEAIDEKKKKRKHHELP